MTSPARFGPATAVLALLALLLTGPTSAQDKAPAEIAEMLELCATCHGNDGRPTQPNTPILWGQEFYYLYVQLRDYKSGLRKNEIMSQIVADLEKEQMQALAQWFSQQKWPDLGYVTPREYVAVAQQAIVAAACPTCHLGAFTGNSRVPRVAGQKLDYLDHTLKAFKTRERANSPSKSALLETFSDDQLHALAEYLAGLDVR